MRHHYYYDIKLYDLHPRQKNRNNRKQNARLVAFDYTLGRMIPVSALILLQSDPRNARTQMSPGMYPPIWSPPLSSISNNLHQAAQYDYPFQGVVVQVVNLNQNITRQTRSLQPERHYSSSASPAWYNSPISPPAPATLKKPSAEKTVELAKTGDVNSSDETSSDDIYIQIHSSSPEKS